ncbi:nuclear transport factor 2 family protein [Streptosporangium subroseum]|uniref:nuclear transport factor 2 family protein n=1 Tax=Streptosporangium subroseum TaxID=106412 RepID=UPI00308D5629|nr:nuclear transport factor 2 family protein [Streptosporangium subroseum]
MNLQEISDRLEIQDVVHQLVRGFDRRDWHTVERLLTDTVVSDYTAMLGGEPQSRTAAEQTRYYQEQLDPLDATMHAATTLLVDLDGDHATASVNILTWLRREAAHDGPMWSNGAAGEIQLTRTAGHWRIARITVRPAWAEGNRGVLDPAL